MMTPPCAGMFSTPRNSICHNTRLHAPTTGLIISSAHSGNITRPVVGRASAFFTGNVLVLRKTYLDRITGLNMIYIYPESHVNPVELSLQRPLCWCYAKLT